tara:strand:- start:5219 stop:5491 length:273 start_codon:yes stop_codon:yes gene_type:complete
MLDDKVGWQKEFIAWEDKRRPIESAHTEDIANVYYDWHCAMAKSFNNSEYPLDYPRSKVSIHFTYKNKHMCFSELQAYIEKHCIKVTGIN